MFGAIKLEYLAGTESRYRVDQSVGILINNIKMLVMSALPACPAQPTDGAQNICFLLRRREFAECKLRPSDFKVR